MSPPRLLPFVLFELRRRLHSWHSLVAVGLLVALIVIAELYTAGPHTLIADAFLGGLAFGLHSDQASDAEGGFERFAVRNLMSARRFVAGKILSLLAWLTLFSLVTFGLALGSYRGRGDPVEDAVRLALTGLLLLPPTFAIEVTFRTRFPMPLALGGFVLCLLLLFGLAVDVESVLSGIGLGGDYGLGLRALRLLGAAAVGFALVVPLSILVVQRRAAIPRIGRGAPVGTPPR